MTTELATNDLPDILPTEINSPEDYEMAAKVARKIANLVLLLAGPRPDPDSDEYNSYCERAFVIGKIAEVTWGDPCPDNWTTFQRFERVRNALIDASVHLDVLLAKEREAQSA